LVLLMAAAGVLGRITLVSVQALTWMLRPRRDG